MRFDDLLVFVHYTFSIYSLFYSRFIHCSDKQTNILLDINCVTVTSGSTITKLDWNQPSVSRGRSLSFYRIASCLTQALKLNFFQEQFCSKVQNFRSKFGLTRSRKCINYENGPKVEGANLLPSYFFRSKCPQTSCKLHICDHKFGALSQ